MPEQASLLRSGGPLDSPLVGHSLWDLALITPGLARSYLFYLIFLQEDFYYLTLGAILPSACSSRAMEDNNLSLGGADD